MLVVRVVAAAALAVSGGVHLDLAGSYDGLGEQVSLGALFRVQGVVALLVAGWLLVHRTRPPALAAVLVGAASLLAVVLSVYVRVPALGPLPELYEPVWYAEKAVAAVAAGVAAAAAALLLGRRSADPVP